MRRLAPALAAICEWYSRNHEVVLDAGEQAIALIGAKEGLAHFVLMTIDPGDVVLCPNPGYPIHQYSVAIAGGAGEIACWQCPHNRGARAHK